MGDGAVGVVACPGVVGVQFIESPTFEEREKGSGVLSAKSEYPGHRRAEQFRTYLQLGILIAKGRCQGADC